MHIQLFLEFTKYCTFSIQYRMNKLFHGLKCHKNNVRKGWCLYSQTHKWTLRLRGRKHDDALHSTRWLTTWFMWACKQTTSATLYYVCICPQNSNKYNLMQVFNGQWYELCFNVMQSITLKSEKLIVLLLFIFFSLSH